jgi:hypothetical protein
LEKQARESLECCKWSLMGNSGDDLEDQNTDSNVASKDCAQEVSEGNKELNWELDSRYPWYLMTVFWPCPETVGG